MVPEPGVPELRVLLPECVADRGVHRGALHRRAVSSAPPPHVHGDQSQGYSGWPRRYRPSSAHLQLLDRRAAAARRRVTVLRLAAALPRHHARHQHRGQPCHAHPTRCANYSHEHHDHAEPPALWKEVQEGNRGRGVPSCS